MESESNHKQILSRPSIRSSASNQERVCPREIVMIRRHPEIDTENSVVSENARQGTPKVDLTR